MRHIFLILFILFSSPFIVCGQKQKSYFVSVTGNDSNSGSLEKPFASLQKARNVIRKQKKLNKHSKFNVFIRQGSYFLANSFVLDSLDSGTEKAPITYRAYQNEKLNITGGITIPINKAVPVTDVKIVSRLLGEVRGQVLQINLKALGIKNYGTIKPKGFGRAYTTSAMELFCNKEAMKSARWPNESMVPIGKVLDQGSIPRNGDFSQRGGKFTYNIQRPTRWTAANDVWISGFFRHGYADDAVQIAKIDTSNKTLTTVQETMYGFEGGKVFQRWFAFNLLEEIDKPGEYYIDRSTGILYFLPPAGKLETIELSLTEEPLLVMENVSFVHFKNITFECARGIGVYIEKGKENKMDNCTFRNLGMVAVSIGKGISESPVLQHNATGKPVSRVIGNLYSYLYDNTTLDREAGSGHAITNCQIYNTGSGGIILGGGNRLTLQKGNNQVVNCRIYNFNRIDRSYKAGVNIDGVGNIIRNCEIYNCPGSAILLHGNDHLIELNNIHHAVTDGDDMGAIYYGRDPSEQGNKVKNNFFHHLGNDHGILTAVYHDDGACGMEVTGNVFYKAGSRTILIGGGNDNVYRNNIFIDCQMAFHIDNRLMGWAKGFVEKKGLFEKRLQAVKYQQAPYLSYHSLAHYFEDSPVTPKRNFIELNVFVNVKTIHNGKPEWTYLGKNLTYFNDPGFVNYAEMNFELLSNSEIFKLLPEFGTIPFSQIGVLKHESVLTN